MLAILISTYGSLGPFYVICMPHSVTRQDQTWGASIYMFVLRLIEGCMGRDRSIVGKVVGLEDLLRQRQSLIEARSSEVEVVSLASSSSISRSTSPSKTPARLNERYRPSQHDCQGCGHT